MKLFIEVFYNIKPLKSTGMMFKTILCFMIRIAKTYYLSYLNSSNYSSYIN